MRNPNAKIDKKSSAIIGKKSNRGVNKSDAHKKQSITKDSSIEYSQRNVGIEITTNTLSQTIDKGMVKNNSIDASKKGNHFNGTISTHPISLSINISNNIVTPTANKPKGIAFANNDQNKQKSARITANANLSTRNTLHTTKNNIKNSESKACVPLSKIQNYLKAGKTAIKSKRNSLITEKTKNSNIAEPRPLNPSHSIDKTSAKPNQSLRDFNLTQEIVLSPKGKIKTEIHFPLTPAQALKEYASKLSDFEKGEILDYKEIYFIGKNPTKKHFSYDDKNGDYISIIGQHVAFRYEILELLGKGSFGQAIKCIDHKTKQEIALKIIKSNKKFQHQATVEVKILKYIRDHDIKDSTNCIKMLDYFTFRKHIVTIILNFLVHFL